MSTGLRPWFSVATPHEDIREGRLSEAVFAANLWAVVQGNAPEVYSDPTAFFEKTYLTTGLTKVLEKAVAALAGEADAGDRIISLQTSFGGGKTHVLLALWHLVKSADRLRRAGVGVELKGLLAGLPKGAQNVAVFTNRTCDATQGRDAGEGVHTRTMWGEIAFQLGGKKLYERVAANDRARSVPQGVFADILRQSAPCLILLDEVADYCVGASAVTVGGSTLADQTISFVQELAEAVDQVKGVAVVATLPASHMEVADSERGEDILKRLEKRFGRMSADRKPVSDKEVYEVVRRRLFEKIGDPKDHKAVADAYLKLYQQHRTDVPLDAVKLTYRERILESYPLHPTLIDAFYLRWGSHSDFQRTRGVLRLLASIVGDLWQHRKTETQSQYLIQPCHLNWQIDALHANLTRLWGAGYDSVVSADIVGDKANAPAVDEEHGGEYANERIAQGIASAILLGSFGGQAERAGYSTKDVKLCVGRPGLNWNYTDGGLLSLEERGHYLQNAAAGNLGKRYWFGTKPSLNKLLQQYRQQLERENFDEAIRNALQRQIKNLLPQSGVTWRVLANPDESLPEQKSLVLLIMPPECAQEKSDSLFAEPALKKEILRLSTKCGSRERTYRNTLLFLVPTVRGLSRLRTALRDVIALESVSRDYGSQLDDEQRKDLDKRQKEARENQAELLSAAYPLVARVEGNEPKLSALAEARPTLSEHVKEAWRTAVDDAEWVLKKVGQVTLENTGLVPKEGPIRIKDAIDAFLRLTDKPMIASRDAVTQGLRQACRDGLVGIAVGTSPSKLQHKHCGEEPMIDLDEDGVWIVPPYVPEVKDKTSTAGPVVIDKPGIGKPGGAKPGTDEPGRVKGKPVKRILITGSVPSENWADVFRSFVSPAMRMDLKKLKLGIQFELVSGEESTLDTNDSAVKSMEESARQLGLKIETE